MRRLRVQLTVLLALLGMLVVAWGAAIFLGARDAARSNASLQATVDRVDELRRAATGLSRDFVAMDTSRRAYLITGDPALLEATGQAEVSAAKGFERMKALSRRWRGLFPLVQQVAAEYRAGVRTGQTELKARERGARAAAGVVAGGSADRHFRRLWALAGFPDAQVADDIVKADADIRRVLPLASLRAGQVVGMADLDRALEALTGWTESEARGRPYAEVLPIATDQVGGPADLVSRYGRKVPVAVSSAPSSTSGAGSSAGWT
jgi:CHASE3 domain sensor protein